MFETMYTSDGVGLAAPQVGILKRLIVVDTSVLDSSNGPIALLNPEIVSREGTMVGEEGCLSFPDIKGDVERSAQIKVCGMDLEGAAVEMGAEGITSRALQHEIDHLDGILFIDHLKPLERQLLRGQLKKLSKESSKRK